MKISIIIPTKDRPDELKKCLTAILSQTEKISQIIIVDSSFSNGTNNLINELKLTHPELEYLRSDPGLTLQRNKGINSTAKDTEMICFFDDDTELTDHYLKTVADRFNSPESDIVGITGNVINEKRKPFPERIFRNIFLIADYKNSRILPSGDAGHVHEPGEDLEVAVLSGCNMCFRSDLFFRHNLLFDQLLGGYSYMEDQDFSIRASKYGKLLQLRDAELVHYTSPVSRIKLKEMMQTYIINSFYLLRKNLSPDFFNYLCYFWRLTGKLIHSIYLSISNMSIGPLTGWIIGICRINNLSKKLK